MIEALKFVPLGIMTLTLGILSSFKKTRENKTSLITAFILWLLTFLFAIGVFD